MARFLCAQAAGRRFPDMHWFRKVATDIGSVIRDVIGHWFGLLGGTMIGTIWLLQAAQGRDLPQQVARGFVLAGLPVALILTLWKYRKELTRLTKKVRLELRFQPVAPYVSERRTRFYQLGVYNHGPGTAENVQVTLTGLAPRPRY